MLDSKTISIIKATAPAVAQHAEAITRRFYTLMFAGNPEVKAFFNQAHQHSGGQQKALAGAICAFAMNIDNLGALGPAVELIAQKHCSLGVKAEHYPIVGKHLLVAIKDVLGDAATDEIIGAWGNAYGFLADVCIAREADIYKEQAALVGGWNGYRKFRVVKKRVESRVVTSFYLEPVDSLPLAPYKPGQYITVRINHPTTPTSPRNYSLSDAPGTGYYRISVKRESALEAGAPGGVVSNYLHDNVKIGDELDIGPACGEFTLEPEHVNGRPVVLISGGIGITPLLAMLKSIAKRKVTTPIYFIHAAQNSLVHALADEARDAVAVLPNAKSHVVYSAPLADDLASGKCDSTGVVDGPLLDRLLPRDNCEYFFCGPKPFMTNLYQALRTRGVSDADIHFEFFGPKQDITAKPAACPFAH